LRLSLHPDGLGRRIRNFREWRAHVLARLIKQIENSADPVLMALLNELKAYPIPTASNAWSATGPHDFAGIVVPLELITDSGVLSFFSTTTIFGTPLDISLSELAIESFFPANASTAEALRRLAGMEAQPAGGS
ncbi:MAG: transcriptional regulator, partial [Xanthobacteraceae bacterium]